MPPEAARRLQKAAIQACAGTARCAAARSAIRYNPPFPETGPSPMNAPASAQNKNWNLVFICWLIACVSTLGSLFFSEVMGFTPCVLCWYQRIFMYPLVILLPLGLFPYDGNVVRYAFPLSLVGALIAGFHLLLVAGYIPESIKPCVQGVPCSEVQIEWFGFVTIPLLSGLSFLTIAVLLVLAHRRNSK